MSLLRSWFSEKAGPGICRVRDLCHWAGTGAAAGVGCSFGERGDLADKSGDPVRQKWEHRGADWQGGLRAWLPG